MGILRIGSLSTDKGTACITGTPPPNVISLLTKRCVRLNHNYNNNLAYTR